MPPQLPESLALPGRKLPACARTGRAIVDTRSFSVAVMVTPPDRRSWTSSVTRRRMVGDTAVVNSGSVARMDQ
jgi:hypothetical protein